MIQTRQHVLRIKKLEVLNSLSACCCETDCPHDQSLGRRSGSNTRSMSIEQQEEKEKEEDIPKYRKSTHNLT